MKIILIAGKSGSGKTEAAHIIKKNLPKTVISNFSKYIKLFAMEMTDWDGSDTNKPRTFLQQMGDTLRNIDESFLPKRILEDTEVYKQYYDNLVICDVRLPEEIDYIKNNSSYDVITILIKSNENNKLTQEQKEHHTENDFLNYSNYDYVIENHYDNQFEQDILNIIEGMK